MHSIRQKCRPKHQVLILKCYPRTTKGAVDVKPNSSELSYLLFYATTRRSKVQKVGAFLEKKTASDVWRARIGNVQVTLQILAALIEKAPRDLPLYAPYVLKIFNLILRSQDITMAEASIPTFEAFCEHHDMASLSADQEYLHQYEEIVRIYASFASTRQENKAQSTPVAIRWRTVGLQAVKSVASSEALATVAGRQLDVVVPILLENIWTDNEDFINLLQNRAETEEQMGTEKTLLKRRASNATVGTVDTAGAHPTTVSDTTADADKMAEENIGVLAIQCLKQIFVVNNRSQIHGATTAVLKFISDRVAQQESVIETGTKEHCRGWAPRVFDLITRWTPVQDRYVILVTAMDSLVRTAQVEATLTQQLVLATMVDYLLKSDINLIGLSVMDVLLGLIQQILIILQLGNVGGPHLQPDNGADEKTGAIGSATTPVTSENVPVPTETRIDLLARLQSCIGSLATHVYYADQISDMVSALLSRLKPSPSISGTVAAIENPAAAMNTIASNAELLEDSSTDGFFSFDTAKIKALEAIKLILLVASHKSMTVAGSLARNRVPVKVWEGTQWLLRDSDGRVRKAYADALLTWLDKEITKSDQRVFDERPRALTKSARDDSATNPSKRAVSNASRTEKPAKPVRSTFLQLLHLAIYENALQYVDNENDIVLLHLLLARLVNSLGVNAVRSGLPMIFKLQEDVQEIDLAIHRIRLGSLCLGYFWILCEKFEFEGSPIGRAIQEEILRRQKGRLWDDRIRFPPIRFDQIGTPGSTTPVSNPPNQAPEEVAFTPFNDRFEMVKLISLSYAASLNSPPASPSASPGRSFTHPILSADAPAAAQDHILSDKIKDQLMSEWSKESVIAVAQESSKTASINGSKTGTNTTTHRNFLAVHGLSNGGSQSGTASSAGGHGHRSSANSTYGTVNGLGTLHKLRKGNGQSPAATSESSRGSVTRVDQLKRILSGQPGTLPSTRAGATHSDGSSESMVSYDFSASEISVNTFNQQNASGIERSASMPESERSRSKSRDRIPSYLERPLASYAIASDAAQDDTNVPPVPPLPSSLAGENIAVQDQAQVQSSPEAYRTGRSAKRSTKSRAGGYSNMPWGEENDKVVDLQDLLNGIEISGEHERGNVAKPPY
ncbi:plasma membrane localization protein [Clarireedia jacksonii]